MSQSGQSTYTASAERRTNELVQARTKLRIILVSFALALFGSLALLTSYMFDELQADVRDRSIAQARELLNQINSRLRDILKVEEARPVDDYSFLRQAQNSLLPVEAIAFSPLAVLPPKAEIPGLIGYFQIGADGVISSPLLPEVDRATILKNSGLFAGDEIETRTAIFKEVQDIVRRAGLTVGSLPNSIEAHRSALEAKTLADGYTAIYRSAVADGKPVIQGFLVRGQDFLGVAFDTVLAQAKSLDYMSVTVSEGANIIYPRPKPVGTTSTLQGLPLIYSTSLNVPLDRFRVEFYQKVMPVSAAVGIIRQLSWLLAVVIFAGLLAVYRLASGQLELAQERSNFVAAITHELQTPLTSIRLYGEMLREGWVTDESKRRSYYDFIFTESERLSRLIQNVLYFGKISTGHFSVVPRPCSALGLLQQVEKSLIPYVEKAGFSLEMVPLGGEAPDTVVVQIDQDAFQQIVMNLVDNAIKFSKEAEKRIVQFGARIVRPESGSSELVFFVRDFGAGVPTGHQDKIFRLFYRANDELTRSTAGTGIGLAIVQQLAKALGTRVTMVNESPGAEFRIHFQESVS